MPRLAAVLLVLASLPSLASDAQARTSYPYGRSARIERRNLERVVRTLKENRMLVEEALDSDPEFRELADRFAPAYRTRMAGGRALVALGSISMIVGSVVGSLMYVLEDTTTGVGILGGVIGGGVLMFIPGVVLMATPTGAEREMRNYWNDHRDDLLRPEAGDGPRLRLARGWAPPRTPLLRLLAVPF